ncbi:MAG: ATP-binding cassette domain-containing protein, partial [Chlorobi bacterium CHB2]|nr:ATP-binding cassette domain-containing protein [Chlorobi bacterium CHB2]
GKIMFQGSVPQLLQAENSLTGAYLTGAKSVDLPKERRKPGKERIALRGASEHNLKNVDLTFPLRTLTVVTGVSGSGKSTLVHDLLYPALAHLKGETGKMPKRLAAIEGDQFIGGVEMVDQSPIGRTPRSNPVTYVKAFDAIRELYALTPGARLHGWKPGYFSFNVPGGRCETCQGEGVVKVEMQFLADLYLTCETCKGRRFNKEVLNATWRGKSIVDVLEMTVDEAIEHFRGERRVTGRLQSLHDVGLGYIRLGQPATTLSGGEAQRVKLAANLVFPAHRHTLFILDEPTTGLHFDDIATLLRSFNALIDAGHSLIVIEHNLDVIRAADWVIDLGPEAGEAGGQVVAEGTPEQVAQSQQSHTGKFLREVLGK